MFRSALQAIAFAASASKLRGLLRGPVEQLKTVSQNY